MRRRTTTSVILSALLLAVAGMAYVTPPAGAATKACHGLDATLVGSRNEVLRGTPGDDVIVSGGASEVLAGAGSDTVCLTVSSARVDLGDADDVALGRVPSYDYLEARPGNIYWQVVSGARGSTEPNPDDVSLGANTDDLTVYGLPTGDLDGDGVVRVISAVEADWVFRRGRLSIDGGPETAFGFPVADLGRARWTSLDWVADDSGLVLSGDPRPVADRPLRIVARGMGNRVELQVGQSATIRGNSASFDRLGIVPAPDGVRAPRIHGSLATGVLAYGDTRIRITGVPTLDLYAFRNAVISAGGPDEDDASTPTGERIVVRGCSARLWGGDHDDDLELVRRAGCPIGAHLVAHGGPGADVLVGSYGDDVLSGGQGRDEADGRGGRDSCRAERTTSC